MGSDPIEIALSLVIVISVMVAPQSSPAAAAALDY